MVGRKPTPIETRIAEGNPRKHAIPAPVLLEGRPGSEILEPPEHLPAVAKEMWRRIVPTLQKVGLLDGVDVYALEIMCTQYARGRKAGQLVNKQGQIVKGSQGQPREHPSLGTERAAAAMFLRFAEQYALTPVARTRLGLAELERRRASDELLDRLGPSNVKVAADVDGTVADVH